MSLSSSSLKWVFFSAPMLSRICCGLEAPVSTEVTLRRAAACQAHLGQRLAAFGGQIVQIHDLLVQFLGQSGIVEESRIVSHATVGRNAVEIAVGQQALSQRAEGDKAFAQLEGGLFQAVLFNGAVEDVVLVLVDDERTCSSARIAAAFSTVGPS